MRKRIVIFLGSWLLLALPARSQVVAELFVSGRQAAHEVWWNKSFSDSSRFSFFHFTRFRVNYADQRQNSLYSYSTVNYRLGKGFGVATGGFITPFGFKPVAALSYVHQSRDWFVNVFPSVELTRRPNLDVFVFVQYRPRLTRQLGLFTQLIGNSNFNFRQHNFSEQSLRAGVDYRSFQFGVGTDFTQLTNTAYERTITTFSTAVGPFVRREF